MLAVAVAVVVPLSILAISKRVKGVIVKQVLL
jgi:hypothetical protein